MGVHMGHHLAKPILRPHSSILGSHGRLDCAAKGVVETAWEWGSVWT